MVDNSHARNKDKSTMVRGNWQKRVETAEARRTAAKQRKQRRDNRSVYKSQVLDLFACLDSTKIHPNHTIHIWVDSAPSGSPPILDMYESDKYSSSGKGGRGDKKGRGRCNSMNEEKKKAHPRSKEQAEPVEEDTANVPRLCRKHFYCGRCDDVGKKGGCRHVHLPKRFKTLCQVVNDKSSKADTKEALSLSESAASVQSDDEGGVEMVYYLSINVDDTLSKDESSLKISDVVSQKLGDEACVIASIVYLAVDNNLLFDRYRGGVIVSDGDIQGALYGGDRRTRRSSSVFSDEGSIDENDNHEKYDSVHLPAHILEYILMFLPDDAVSSMALVCQQWHQEIGQESPNLWRRLLERRDWPMPDYNATSESSRDVFRTSFLNHYTVVRDIEAVGLAIGAIYSGASRKLAEEKEAVCEVFSARRLAPQEPNGCIGVRNWSSGQVLAAYSNDCTLRLFKAVAKSVDTAGGSPRACRELVCVSVDPFRNTKRQTCRLVAMDLDEEVIGCLCHVIGDDHDHEAYILAVTRRDDFLAASGSKLSSGGASLEEGKVHIIDIGEAVLNYLISCEEVDHRLLRLFDYLSDGGDASEVEIIVSQSVKACGYGRFLVEVAISIPSTPLEEEEVDEVMILLDRKLMLFSASAEAIVWAGETNPTDGGLLPRHKDVTIASFRQVRPGERRATCSLAFVSSASHTILWTELDSVGQMLCPQVIEAAGLVRNEILENGWQMQNAHRRPVVITPSDIVTVDSLFRQVEGGTNKVNKAVISFYPRFVADISYATLALGDCQAVRMQSTHKDYVVILCRFRKSDTRTAEDDADPIDGQWFGVDAAAADESRTVATIEAVIVHVPSRKVIHQVFLFEEYAATQSQINYDIPIFFTPSGSGRGTIGVGLSWKGLVMTGRDVRDVGFGSLQLGDDDATKGSRKQKKKKRQPNKTGKKDGFARGMSLRG